MQDSLGDGVGVRSPRRPWIGSEFCIFTISIFAAWAAGVCAEAREKSSDMSDVPASTPVAVVELFTSQACPNCPSAEANLKEIAAKGRERGQKIIPLEFHVDYWSPASRRDPLSKREFEDRQQTYTDLLKQDGRYTPQMIVNGKDEFVGSERDIAKERIASALTRPARVGVKLRAAIAGDGTNNNAAPIGVEYKVSTVVPHAVLNLAVVERGVSDARTQRVHENIVRVFKTVALDKGGMATVQLMPSERIALENSSVVAYVQDVKSMAILGAASVDLRPAASIKKTSLEN